MSTKTKIILTIISIGIIAYPVWLIHGLASSNDIYIDGADFSFISELLILLVCAIAIIAVPIIIGIIWTIGFVITDIRYNKARAVYLQKNFFVIIIYGDSAFVESSVGRMCRRLKAHLEWVVSLGTLHQYL